MKRLKHIFIILFLCLPISGHAQQKFMSRIVDADTGEPMPCVGIYVSGGRTALTNFDGEFQIEAMPDDTLRLSFVGYKTMWIKASQLPSCIKMNTTVQRMKEVSVWAAERMMSDIARRADKAFRQGKKQRARYFYRQTSVLNERMDMAEAFVDARSAINLREMLFVSGRHGMYANYQWEKSDFVRSNLHHVLELAPMMADVPFWNQLVVPLLKGRSISDYQRLYDISVKEIDSDGQHMYALEMAKAPGNRDSRPTMTGTLYVEQGTLNLLAFRGRVENVKLDFQRTAAQGGTNVPLTLDFHITYGSQNGFPEVETLGMQTKWDKLQTRTLLFRVGDASMEQGAKDKRKRIHVEENMLTAMDAVGYDSAMWSNEDIVMRTAEEERIARGIAEHERSQVGIHTTSGDSLTAIAKLADRARRFGERIPQEKVYVHLDNTCYFLGDTIWFAAYTRRTDTGRPSRVSRVLYCELWNHDGFLVERKLVEMRDGRGSGFFALPDTLYSGYFELRAYTRWQLNWGQTEHPHKKVTERKFYNEEMARDYFRDYEKLYSRVFPVYDHPEEEGEFVRSMTLRPIRRYHKDTQEERKLMLTLFPEGGNLTYGLPCRVAFEAAMDDGEAVEGTLQLHCGNEVATFHDESGSEQTSVATEHRGRGTFVFTPEAGRTYRAVFTTKTGETTSTAIKDIGDEGVALHVGRSDTLWTFDIHSSLQRTLGFVVMHEGVTQCFQPVGNERITIQNNELPVGINQVTIFDEDGRVWADRLFFATSPHMALPSVVVSGIKEGYEPYEEVKLGVKCTMPTTSKPQNLKTSRPQNPTTLSLSVRDAVRQDYTYDTGNILTEMLLASEIKGFVPHPEWYFEKDDKEHRRGLDLLLMTQGWRRFRWRDMAVEGQWDITHPAEQSQVVEGSVHPYLKYKPYTETYEDSTDANSYIELLNRRPIRQKDSINVVKYQLGVASQKDHIGEKEFNDMIQRQKSFVSRRVDNSEATESQFEYMRNMKLRHDVRVHSEFVQPDNPLGYVVGDMTTREGRFRMELPRFYGDCIFFLTAKDTTLWDKKIRRMWNRRYRLHTWVQPEDDEYQRLHEDAEFYVRLRFPYPRWVKPYDYYQTGRDSLRLAPPVAGSDNDVRQLNEVTARARWHGLRRLDLSKPVLVVDAYEAVNAAMDAGLLTDPYILKEAPNKAEKVSFAGLGYQNMGEVANACILNYFGDMNMDRRYLTALLWDSIRVAGDGIKQAAFVAKETQRQYSRLDHIDKVYLYSDYAPRCEGDKRYIQDNQPTVEISLHKLPGNQRRLTYRDRRYILHGFANQADFYHPDYHRNPPRNGQKDYRRTLYWNPCLQLDDKGEAQIRFFNGSRRTHIQVEAEGQDSEGNGLVN